MKNSKNSILILVVLVLCFYLYKPFIGFIDANDLIRYDITCIFKKSTGLPCPLCGLTRSISETAYGNLNLAVMHNPAGPLVFFFIGITLFVFIYCKFRSRSVSFELRKFIIILSIILVIIWAFRLLLHNY
ncbi:DUF2752 domain-containing protein [candidate division KSB1 bacterium]